MKKICLVLTGFFILAVFSPALAATEDLAGKLAGRTLVATEAHGEIWWVDPTTQERHYLGKPADFLTAMRQLALGVSKKDFDSFKGQAPRRLAGKFLLLVGENGKIAYVNPVDLKIHKFENISEAIEAIKQLALGITNQNLNRIRAHGQTALANQEQEQKQSGATGSISEQSLKIIAENFVNNNLLADGVTAKVETMTSEYGLYKLGLKLSNRDDLVYSYISPDGKKFFTQALDITNNSDSSSDNSASDSSSLPQQAKPVVELFTMSHCPYGLQMEKAILPAVKALGNSLDFQLKFVYYAMHGKTEVTEQLNQYCLQTEQNDKLIPYLECFSQAGDTNNCLTSIGADIAKLAKCVIDADQQFSIYAAYDDQANWLSGRYPKFAIHQTDNSKYQVAGSPTLIINGKVVTAERNPASLLKLICSGFTQQPAACQTSLSTASPSAGFGSGTTANQTTGGCGS